MPTETLPTRAEAPVTENISSGFIVAAALHAAVLGGLIGWAFISHTGRSWGDRDPVAGSIQASMVNSLPLPPRQRTLDNAVLTSEKPSIAPTPPPPEPVQPKAAPVKPAAEPKPKPDEIPIPVKATPPKPVPKVDAPPQPAATRRPPAPAPPTPKATTGDTAGVQIPQSITQLKNGTASITVEERSFGDRYAYYIRLISQKVNQNWQQAEADPHSSNGKRTTIIFTIDRDGTPIDAKVGTRSGSPTLDSSALRAIQRIDTFGPLPQGDHITVEFSFDFRAL